jgi:hypothetical protein
MLEFSCHSAIARKFTYLRENFAYFRENFLTKTDENSETIYDAEYLENEISRNFVVAKMFPFCDNCSFYAKILRYLVSFALSRKFRKN